MVVKNGPDPQLLGYNLQKVNKFWNQHPVSKSRKYTCNAVSGALMKHYSKGRRQHGLRKQTPRAREGMYQFRIAQGQAQLANDNRQERK